MLAGFHKFVKKKIRACTPRALMHDAAAGNNKIVRARAPRARRMQFFEGFESAAARRVRFNEQVSLHACMKQVIS
jgi:hypothetical protein